MVIDDGVVSKVQKGRKEDLVFISKGNGMVVSYAMLEEGKVKKLEGVKRWYWWIEVMRLFLKTLTRLVMV